MKVSNSNRKYLVLKGTRGSGLGDKIRALVVAILYAKLTNRIIYVDWNDSSYGKENINYFPYLFEFINTDFTLEAPRVTSVWPRAWQGRLDYSVSQILIEDGYPWRSKRAEWDSSYVADISRLDYKENAIVLFGFGQLSKLIPFLSKKYKRWNRGNIDILIRDILKGNLRPIKSIRDKVKDFCSANFAGKFIIGIHVRYTEESRKNRIVSLLSHYVNVIKKTLYDYPDAYIFLATDNIDVEKTFKQIFGQNKIFTIKKWFPKAGEPIHKNKSCPNGLDSARDCLIDMYLLAECNYLITLLNSSFSIIARLLSSAKLENKAILTSIYGSRASKLLLHNKTFLVTDHSIYLVNHFFKIFSLILLIKNNITIRKRSYLNHL